MYIDCLLGWQRTKVYKQCKHQAAGGWECSSADRARAAARSHSYTDYTKPGVLAN